MLSTAEKTSRHNTIPQKNSVGGVSFLQRKGEDAFFGEKQRDNFLSPTTSTSFIQPKLNISQPDDPQEKEADAMAHKVMTMPEPAGQTISPSTEKEIQPKEEEVQTKLEGVQENCVQCQAEKKEEDDKKIHAKLSSDIHRKEESGSDEKKHDEYPSSKNIVIDRKPLHRYEVHTIQREGRGPPTASGNFEQTLSSTKGSGTPLPEITQQFMESRFNADFSGVRIHTGSTATAMSKDIHAQAFTHGNDIYFNSGKYSPHSSEGSTLLAHELTHTIQQGASKAASPSSATQSKIATKRSLLQRKPGSPIPRVSNLNTAVNLAKGEIGKVNAGQKGADGNRLGWERLVEFFQTSLGSEMITAEGAKFKPGSVPISNIKNKKEVKGMKPNQNDPTVRENRDAMPSWCGIFAFWALNKSGLPMPKWMLGRPAVKIAAAYPPGYIPRAGDIAYRDKFSHFALVSKTEGSEVTTINGNTAGSDNLGGQIQERTDPLSKWTAFFDPLYGIDTNKISLPPALLDARINKLFPSREQNGGEPPINQNEEKSEHSNEASDKSQVQAKPLLSNWSVSAKGQLQSRQINAPPIQKKESKEPEQETIKDKEGKKSSIAPVHAISRMAEEKHCKSIQKKHESDTRSSVKYSSTSQVQRQCCEACAHCGSKEEEEHSVKNNSPPALGEAIIQKDDEEDGMIAKKIKEKFWEIVKEISPEIHDIFRYKGFINWAKEKLASFASTTIETLSAPVKLGKNIITKVKSTFSQFMGWMKSAAERLKKGDCTPFAEASEFITNILQGIADPALEKLKEFLAPIKKFIDDVWNGIGKPLWDFVSKIFGTIWDTIKSIAEKIWGYVKEIINFYAELWHEFLRAVGFEGDDPDSFWEQIKKKVSELWEAIKAKLEPYKKQLMIVAGIILLLSPAGPLILAAAAFTGIMYAASKLRHYMQDHQAIIQERGFIKGVLIPEFFNALNKVGSFLKSKAKAITDALKKGVDSLKGISKDLGDTLLSALNTAVDWVAEKLEAMSDWAENQLNKLVDDIEDAFDRIMKFLQPVVDILSEVGKVLADYYKLPFVVLNKLFKLIPACIRKKIIDFLTKHVFKHIPLLRDIKDVGAAWVKMEKKAMQIIDMLFIHGQILKAMWEIFNVLLDAMNFPKELAVKVYNKAFDVFDQIIEKPKAFFMNFLETVKMGFSGFFDRKWTHLKNGFTQWLFGAVSGTGFYIPQGISFGEIFKMFGSIFSLGLEKIYERLAKKIGKEKVDKIRKVMGYISKGAAMAWKWLKILHENSLDGVIEMIKAKGAELWSLAVDAIIDWIVGKVIEKTTVWLISMLDPTGIMAVINSCIAIYKAVETFIEKAREVLEMIEGVLDNMAEIIAGSLAKSALSFEKNIARAIPLILEFLANQLSMGKLGKKIKEMAKKAEDWINEKVDWLIDKGLAFIDNLIAMGKSAIESITQWWTLKKNFNTRDGKGHSIYFKGKDTSAEIMVASQEQNLKDYFAKKETAVESITNAEEKKKQLGALRAAKKSYDKAIDLKDKIDPLDKKEDKTDKDKEKLKELIQKQRDEFETVGDNLAILGVDDIAGQTFTTNITPSSGSGITTVITADPLTPIPGNTHGSAPVRGIAGPAVPGWDHLIKVNAEKGNPKEGKVFDDWLRMHLIHEHMHGPADLFNLVPANTRPNTAAYNGVEKGVVEKLRDKNTILWYETHVTYRANTPDKNYLYKFPEEVSMRWAEYTLEEGTSNLKKGDVKNAGPYKVDEPPALLGASSDPNIRIRSIGEERLLLYYKSYGMTNKAAERINSAALNGQGDTLEEKIIDHYAKKGYSDKLLDGDLAILKSLSGIKVKIETGDEKITDIS